MRTSDKPVSRVSTVVAALACALGAPAALAVCVPGSGTYCVTNTLDSGAGSLRQAVQDANTNCGIFTNPVVNFDIPGTGPFVITPSTAIRFQCFSISPMHATLDGYSQTGSSPNTDPSGFNASIQIVLDGASFVETSFPPPAIHLQDSFNYGSSLVVRGLEVRNFVAGAGTAIGIKGNVMSFGNSIHHNSVGIHAAGFSAGNLARIGSSLTEDRNIIWHQTADGIRVGPSGGHVVIENNFIGTTDGNTPASNGGGIYVQGATDLDIRNNVIHSNATDAIALVAGTNLVVLDGNFIGINTTLTQSYPNGGNGISILGSSPVYVGSNIIASNGGSGVVISAASNNQIFGNAIYGNSGDGITMADGAGTSVGNVMSNNSVYLNGLKDVNLDFAGGPLPNDTLDPDTGPNLRQNHPIVTSVTHVGGNDTVIAWTFNSEPTNTYQIQFFRNLVPGVRSGYGYVGQVSPVTTDASGNASGSTTINGGLFDNISATALNDATFNTSEYSAAVAVTATPAVSIVPNTHAFGSVEVGASSGPVGAVLTSTGTANWVINAISASPTCAGPAACSTGPFVCSIACVTGPPGYPNGNNCGIGVTFAPVTTGAFAETIYVCDNTPSSPNTITLSGTGIAPPPPTLLPASHNFLSVPLGGFSGSQTFTVHNPSASSITLSAFAVTGPFVLGSVTCGASLASLASCSGQVTFQPVAVGPATGALTMAAGATALTAALQGTGVAPPPATISPPSIDFGSVNVGSVSAIGTFTVNNPALVAVGLSAFTVSGPFVLHATTCVASLPPSSSCTADVKFAPIVIGGAAGLIQVSANGVSISSALTGTGTAAAALAITPSNHDFGVVLVGSTPTQAFTITNPSPVNVALSGPAVTGAGFQLASTTCVATLAAGASCGAVARFVPQANVNYSGSLAVSGSGTTASATLVGTGLVQPVLEITAGPIDLGNTTLGSPALTLLVTLRNTGNAALTIDQLTVGAPFTLTGACPLNLLPGESCVVTITLQPTAVGTFNAALVVVTNAPGGSRSIPVRAGVQARAEPIIRVSPVSIGFGARLGSTTSPSQRVTVTNEGGADATAIALSIAQPHFRIANSTCGPVLAPQASCNAEVLFEPIGFGPKLATLRVTSNAPAAAVGLSGSGCRPPPITGGRVQRLDCSP